METANAYRIPCAKCNKVKNTIRCPGCGRNLCLDDMNAHREELKEQLNETEDQFKQFASDLEKQNLEPHKNPLIQQIDQWEQQSIKKIRQVAEEIRNKVSSTVISYVP